MSPDYKKIAIILPTFNESKNLRSLLNMITNIAHDVYIVIVDDSPENENKKIKNIADTFKHVEVITRQKKLGRGSAVFKGFTHALKNKKIELFIEMDTDLAHNPGDIPKLYNALKKQNVDLVIGSRYLKTSRIVNWPKKRLVLSILINHFLNLLFGLNIHDYTNGFRIYRRKAIEYLVKRDLREKNFIALSESAFLLKKKGFKIIEVPVTFTDRKRGVSTVSTYELLTCFIGAFKIRFRNRY